MLFVYIENKEYANQIRYSFDTIFSNWGISKTYLDSLDDCCFGKNDLLIGYTDRNETIDSINRNFPNVLIIKASGKLFGNDYMKKQSIPDKVSRYFDNNVLKEHEDIISIFNDGKELYINRNENHGKNIITNIDFMSDLFFMLSRYEEVVNDEAFKNDLYERFGVKDSIAFKFDFLDRPIINEHMNLIWKLIQWFELDLKRKRLWQGYDFAACLTHDIDDVKRFKSFFVETKNNLRLIIRNKNPRRAIKNITEYLKSKLSNEIDKYWTFESMMDMENKYSFKSSFYFMSGGTSDVDNLYDINDNRIKDIIQTIEKSGWEAGYHGSFNSYYDSNLMRKEKKTLDGIKSIKEYGCRQHYLRFKAPITWNIQNEIGLKYDSTLSFADGIGFRCGFCMPFKPYDILENKVIDIWEIPLIIMDTTFHTYLKWGKDRAKEEIVRFINIVKKHNGVFTFLIHNSSFSVHEELQWDDLYPYILKIIYENNGKGMSGIEVVKHFELTSNNL